MKLEEYTFEYFNALIQFAHIFLILARKLVYPQLWYIKRIHPECKTKAFVHQYVKHVQSSPKSMESSRNVK